MRVRVLLMRIKESFRQLPTISHFLLSTLKTIHDIQGQLDLTSNLVPSIRHILTDSDSQTIRFDPLVMVVGPPTAVQFGNDT